MMIQEQAIWIHLHLVGVISLNAYYSHYYLSCEGYGWWRRGGGGDDQQ